jgi:hypothetical protein
MTAADINNALRMRNAEVLSDSDHLLPVSKTHRMEHL